MIRMYNHMKPLVNRRKNSNIHISGRTRNKQLEENSLAISSWLLLTGSEEHSLKRIIFKYRYSSLWKLYLYLLCIYVYVYIFQSEDHVRSEKHFGKFQSDTHRPHLTSNVFIYLPCHLMKQLPWVRVHKAVLTHFFT